MILKTQSLIPAVRHVICDKATEYPFTGEYDKAIAAGTYLCRQCGLALFRAQAKFHSGCGWPSFDEDIPQTVTHVVDKDGQRTEIICARCQGHLGHVFQGESFTAKNTRHCVNSASLDFVPDIDVLDTEEAIFAAGCFWGVEYFLKKLSGVLKTEVGYTGGHRDNPSYEEVCHGDTGHVEAIRVVYDPKKISYEEVTKYFFEIHDPAQSNGQGPDIGSQYLSEIFYFTDEQKNIAEKCVQALKKKSYVVTTKILPVSPFWPAEIYHQDYYSKTGKVPYCHAYRKRFD